MLTKIHSLIDEISLNTKSLHHELDKSPLIKKMLSPDLQITEYRLILERFHTIYSIIEPAILDFELKQSQHACTRYQSRLPALERELATLNYQVRKQINHDNSTFIVDSLENYLGVRYVLDGSCHGAKFLLPRLTKHFNATQVDQLAYWKLLDNLNSDWLNLVQVIDSYQDNKQAEFIKAARNTFKLFIMKIQTTEVSV